jgi:hypothetical protein
MKLIKRFNRLQLVVGAVISFLLREYNLFQELK